MHSSHFDAFDASDESAQEVEVECEVEKYRAKPNDDAVENRRW